MLITTFVLLSSTCLVIFLIIVIKEIIRHTIQTHYILKLPGPANRNFIIGNGIGLTTDQATIHTLLRLWARRFYPIYYLRMAAVGSVHIISPEDFELISSNIAHNKKSGLYSFLYSWLRRGLLTSFGRKWQRRRKLLTPAFHFNILQEFVPIFNKDTEDFVELLKVDEYGKEFTEINSRVSDFSLKAIAATSMGVELNFRSEKEMTYKNAIHDVVQIFLQRLFRPWLYLPMTYIFSKLFYKERRLVSILHSFTKEVIEKRKTELVNFKRNGSKKMALLDLLLKAKTDSGLIDDYGIREEVDTFMFEGHDTVSTSICFTLMLLANHEAVQRRILEEMSDVLCGNLKKKPNYNELQELKYMERCIKESLRLYPSVFFISRELGEDLKTHSGYLLKKKSIIFIHIYDIHHNPDIYPDPEKFDPDRFLPENCANRHPFAYVPFSAGPRNCIGQRFAILEIKALLCGILSNFVLKPIDTQESIVLISDIILRTKTPIKVRFVPRNI